MSIDASTSPMATTDPGEEGDRRPRQVGPGSLVGRFVVVAALGAGGAGSVFAAYDPELDRRVALKLLHETDGAGDDATVRRLIHEARALARLSHPNVVVIHDVGVDAGRPFLATELVDGTDLRQWLAARPDLGEVEVLRLFEGAGRGLAAAHAAGLVHGDFKPANVLVGGDGRPRVADFGLARLQARTAVPATPTRDDGDDSRSPVLVGTPYYMAPEQLDGREPDARSDQFAYCLALLEALARRRVYDTVSISGLLLEKQSPVPDAILARLSPGLRRIVARGLADDPAARHRSMEVLLDEIAAVGRRRRRLVGAAWVLGATALGGATTWAWSASAAVPCEDAGERLDGLWDGARRRAVTEAFAAAHQWGADIAPRVTAAIDAYAKTWTDGAAQACLAAHHRVQPPELLRRRAACLDDRLDHLVALVEVFADADAETVLRSDAAVRAIPMVGPCADPGSLRALDQTDDPAAVAAVESLLRRIDAALGVTRFERAAELLKSAEAAVAGTGLAAQRLAVDVRRGRYHYDTGDFAAARVVLEPTVLAAFSAGEDETALRGLGSLVRTLGPSELAFDAARGWARWAEPLAIRSKAPASLFAETLEAIAMAEAVAGDPAAAKAALERAVAVLTDADATPVEIALVQVRLGDVMTNSGESAEARALVERAREVIIAELGATHPDGAAATGILGVILSRLGEPRGEALLREAVDDLRVAYGPDHPALAPALNNVGGFAIERGDFATARAALLESLALETRRFGADHLVLGPTLVNLAAAALWADDPTTGLAELERAERIFLAADANRPELAGVYRQKSYALAELGRVPEAVEQGRRAVEAFDRRATSRLSARGDARVQLGWVQTLAGDIAGAHATYEAGIALLEPHVDRDPEVRRVLLELLTARAELLESSGRAAVAARDRERIAALQPRR